MPIIDLSLDIREQLLSLPETGMGFQIVSARFWGTRKPFLVLNAERALDLSDLPDFAGPFQASQIGLWINSELSGAVSITSTPSLAEAQLLAIRVGPLASSPTLVTGASPPPSSLVKTVVLSGARRFHRFSPFYPDRRVDPITGDFLPGTYACPESEVPFVPTGFCAVGRFALPSSLPASHHYVVEARKGTEILFGTVAPAFGQAGGGVEALFQKGAVNVAAPKIPSLRIPDE